MRLSMRYLATIITLFICFNGPCGCSKKSDSDRDKPTSSVSGQADSKGSGMVELNNIYIAIMEQFQFDSFKDLEKLSANQSLISDKLSELNTLEGRIEDARGKEIYDKLTTMLSQYNDAAAILYDVLEERKRISEALDDKQADLNRRKAEDRAEYERKMAEDGRVPPSSPNAWKNAGEDMDIKAERSKLYNEKNTVIQEGKVKAGEQSLYFFHKELGIANITEIVNRGGE